MANHFALQIGVHAGEFAAFLLRNALNRDAGHHSHHVAHVGFSDGHTLVLGLFFPGPLGLLELVVEDSLLVTQPRRFLVPLGADDLAFVLLDFLDLLLNLDNLLRHVDVGQMHAASHLIQGVNGLVWQVTVCDVPARERHTGVDGLVGVLDAVVFLVFVFDVVEDLGGLLNCGGFHHHLLETPLQGAVLLDVLAVFVQGGGSDALNLTAGQGWLEHVGCVQRSTCPTGAHDGVDFVDEQDDVRRLLQLVHHRFHALFKLTTVLGARDKRSHIQRDNAFVEQHTAHLLLHDAQGQTFSNRGFPDAGFPHQNGVVLFAAAQNLADALNLFCPGDDGVEAPFLGHAREVPAKVGEDWRLGLGVAFASRWAIASAA